MSYFLSPALAQLRAEINAVWPHRDKTSDGWIGDTSHAARPSDHNPDWNDGGIVRAIDVDEDLVVGLAEVGKAMPLVEHIIRDDRTRYVIYEGRIWTRDTGRWSPYSGPNAHRHHIHVSVRSVGDHDRDASPWGIATQTTTTTPAPAPEPVPDVQEDDMRGLIEALYRTRVGREGTTAEVDRWTVSSAEADRKPPQLVQLFLDARAEGATVDYAYREFLGRKPTPAERDRWLAQKPTVRAVRDGVAKSPEAQKRK